MVGSWTYWRRSCLSCGGGELCLIRSEWRPSSLAEVMCIFLNFPSSWLYVRSFLSSMRDQWIPLLSAEAKQDK